MKKSDPSLTAPKAGNRSEGTSRPAKVNQPPAATQRYFVETKLYRPKLTEDYVARERLANKFHQFQTRPLTVVSAPAGYGKTTLLSDWASRSEHPCAWLSLDDGDNELAVFLAYLIGAIRTIVPEFGDELIVYTQATRLPPIAVISALLIQEIAQVNQDINVILDDFHFISNPEIFEILDGIFAHPPRYLHLALLTRHDPPIYLNKLRAGNQLVELRASDLRFSPEESLDFLARVLGESGQELAAGYLTEKTEGWAVGLRLATTAINQNPGFYIQPSMVEAENHFVIDYLIHEVLSQQPVAVRDFLLYSSIPERFCLSLCAEIMGDYFSQEVILSALAAGGLFIEALDNQGNWYRFHDLFRQFLQHQLLEQVGPEGVAQIHALAGHWYAEKGQIEAAVTHTVRSGDIQRAAVVFGRYSNALLNEESWFLIESLLAKFPPDALMSDPILITLEAWLNLGRFRLDRVKANLNRLTVVLPFAASLAEEDRRFVESSICSLSSVLVHWSHDFDNTITLARQALDTSPKDWNLLRSYAWLHLGVATYHRDGLAAALSVCAEEKSDSWVKEERFAERSRTMDCFVYLTAADLTNLLEASLRVIDIVGDKGLVSGYGWFPAFVGFVHYMRNDLETAERYLTFVWDRRYLVHPQSAGQSAIVLGRIYVLQDRLDDAWEISKSAVQYSREIDAPQLLATAKAFQIELAWHMGARAPARHWIAQGGPPVHANIMPSFYETELALPRLLLLQNTSESRHEAIQMLANLREMLARIGNSYSLIEVLVLLSRAHEAENAHDQADALLLEALELAAPGGFIRPFIDQGEDLLEPLRRLASNRALKDYVQELLEAFPEQTPLVASSANIALPEPLTEREMEVIELLKQRLSNKEIAEVLVISPTTAKRHTINIYQKLGVNSRREAVVTATSLGLLPTT